jgi:hypothetical protein
MVAGHFRTVLDWWYQQLGIIIFLIEISHARAELDEP